MYWQDVVLCDTRCLELEGAFSFDAPTLVTHYAGPNGPTGGGAAVD